MFFLWFSLGPLALLVLPLPLALLGALTLATAGCHTPAPLPGVGLVDLERYSISGNLLPGAVVLRNTGSDARSWLYRTDVQASTIDRLLNNGARRI